MAVLGSSVLLSGIVLSCMVSYSAAITCFYCNSANNSACTDLDALAPADRARVVPAVHCETSVPGPVHVQFFCRKIVQTIFHSHREAELRVTRGCGWVPHARPCYRADNSDHLETVCQCHHDRCNGAPRVLLAPVLVAVVVVVVAGLCL